MMRSLVQPIVSATSPDAVIRRNLQQESLIDELNNNTSVWIDMVDPGEDEIEWLQSALNLHPLIIQDVKRTDTRPSLLAYTDHIFISVFQPVVTMNKVTSHEIHCIIGDNYFITVRESEATAVDNAYDRVAHNPNYWDRDVAYFLYLTVQQVVDEYFPLVDTISNKLNDLEEQLLAHHKFDIRSTVYRLKQNLIALRQVIAPHREVLSSVIGEERLARTNENRDLFRHLYERLMRVYDIIDSQRDLSSNVLDLLQSHEAQELGKAVNRLTIFSMIFLPLTFIIGLFELNFITPETQFLIPISGTALFYAITITMLLIVVGMVWYFRRQGWL